MFILLSLSLSLPPALHLSTSPSHALALAFARSLARTHARALPPLPHPQRSLSLPPTPTPSLLFLLLSLQTALSTCDAGYGKGRFDILPIYKAGGKKVLEPQNLAPKPVGTPGDAEASVKKGSSKSCLGPRGHVLGPLGPS